MTPGHGPVANGAGNRRFDAAHGVRAIVVAAVLLLLAGCATSSRRAPQADPAVVRARVLQLLPSSVADRSAWAADIQAAFAAQAIMPTTQNVCAVLAVTEQESGFKVDPVVPDLARIARREIDRRAAARHVPRLLVDAALLLKSPDGRSYRERLQHARTERQLSEMFEDFIGSVPLGKRLFGELNPVHTGGPMQVSVDFAEAHADAYPYSHGHSIRREVFSRRGGMYFGILHLLGYPTHYPEIIYRFADFNAGWYASRNAALQNAISVASGRPLALDGDLVNYGSDKPGATEMAVRSLAARLDMSERAIHRALMQGESYEFQAGKLYKRIYALAERTAGKPLPRAILPGITLKSPKITRKLTTAWFAQRVDDRWQRCMRNAGS